VNVEVFDGNNVLPLDEVIARLDADIVGIFATAVGYEYAVKVAEIAFSKYVAGAPLDSIENLVYRQNGRIKENVVELLFIIMLFFTTLRSDYPLSVAELAPGTGC